MKAIFDSCGAGPVPCKVLGVVSEAHATLTLRLEITEDRRPYKAGQEVLASSTFVVPRSALVMRHGQYRIVPFDRAAFDSECRKLAATTTDPRP